MGLLLVILQFVLIALIALPLGRLQFSVINVSLFLAGLGVFGMAFFSMKRSTFTVMPDPRPGGELVTSGIYGSVRHPMYLAVLLCAVAACLAYAAPWKWLASLALLAVLVVKMRYEEQRLSERFEAYADYRKRSKALIPFIF